MTRFALLLAAGVSALSLASAAQAADLIISEPAPVGIIDVSGNWDGVFVGVFAGGGWGSVTDVDDVTLADDIDLSGWLVGVDIGANFTVGSGLVAGVVADIAWTDISGDDGVDVTYDVDWVGSLRGRLGLDGGAFLPYLTGGLAFASATADNDGTADSNTHIGWTVGAGVEFAATDNMSIDLLYRYSDYGSQTYDLGSDTDLSLRTHTVTAGLHWKF